MDDENNCKYVSSRGILKACDIHSIEPISDIRHLHDYDFTKVIDNSVIYIATSAIPFFIMQLFENIKHKFILVTGDSDSTVPYNIFPSNEEFIKFIESDKILHWFAQNCIVTHSKITQIPIGLDYHTMSKQNHTWGIKTSSTNQEHFLKNIKLHSKPFYERKIKCYSNFHFFTTTKFGYDRKNAIEKIPNEVIYYEPTKIQRIYTWKNQSEYAFVVSPHGNGLDCHRTWEALCLGCIPIVKTSPLDNLYSDLPVLILDDWTSLNQELLDNTVIEFKRKDLDLLFNYEKLTLQYWMQKINSYKE
uniref:Exostosin GT47 domain-containing protein n=1 Tax=viral metagenome TaxID=1070528 RepID=A0A6C0E3V9_9ZZZZ